MSFVVFHGWGSITLTWPFPWTHAKLITNNEEVGELTRSMWSFVTVTPNWQAQRMVLPSSILVKFIRPSISARSCAVMGGTTTASGGVSTNSLWWGPGWGPVAHYTINMVFSRVLWGLHHLLLICVTYRSRRLPPHSGCQCTGVPLGRWAAWPGRTRPAGSGHRDQPLKHFEDDVNSSHEGGAGRGEG